MYEHLTKGNVWRKLEKEKENKTFYTYISISIYSVLKKYLDVSTSLLKKFRRECITCPDQRLNNASVLKHLDSMTCEFVLTQSSTASQQICIIKLTWNVFYDNRGEIKYNSVNFLRNEYVKIGTSVRWSKISHACPHMHTVMSLHRYANMYI